MPAEPSASATEALAGERLDAAARRAAPSLSRRLIAQLIADGAVHVNGRPAAKGWRLRPGDRVTVHAPQALLPEPTLAVPVVYEDAHAIVLDKPGGMPGHALDPRARGTVANLLVGRWPETAGVGPPLAAGLVHRLDTGTSGLLVAARSPEAFATLRAAFQRGAVEKRYLALVAGEPPPTAVVDEALAHDPGDRRRMRAARAGDRAWPARTTLTTLARGDGRALVQATMRTGVTHQVRVHLALLGYPLLGDRLYGGPDVGLPPERHALHAARLSVGGTLYAPPLELVSELPPDLLPLRP